MPIKLPYLMATRKTKNGPLRYFVRQKGQPLVRVRGKPGSAEFMVNYRAAFTQQTVKVSAAPSAPVINHTWRWLCSQFLASAEFGQRAGGTRGQYRRVLESTWAEPLRPGAIDLFADVPLPDFEAKHVRVLRDRKKNTPEAANQRVKYIRTVFKWGVEAEPHVVTSNPARDVAFLRSNNPDGHHTWTVEEVRRYEERHPIGTKARLALAIFLFTGVRRADAVALGRPNVRDGWIVWTEAKNKDRAPKDRAIPLLPQLQEVLDAIPLLGTKTWLVTDYGKPFTVAGFGNKMRQWCDEAGLPHCSAHGLRKAGATIAAENGATEKQIQAIFGWETLEQVELYTRKARAKKLAGDSMHLLVAKD
jgi:integrase